MKRTRKKRTKYVNMTGLLILLLLGVIGFSFLLGLSLSQDTPSERQQMRIAEQRAVMPWRITSRIVTYAAFGIFAKVALVVMACYVVFYLIAIARNWLDLRARLIRPQSGIFPLVRANDGQLYDPNRAAGENPYITLAALQVQNTAALPRGEKTVIRTTQKAPKVTSKDMSALEDDNVNLPQMVRLPDICEKPTLENLTLGVSQNGIVKASLFDLMHVLSVGASGFGKSAFLRALIWQLAQVEQDVGIVAIDINGSEFNTIRSWARLLYPVARNTNDAVAVLGAVRSEIEKRKTLYEAIPTAYDLPSYNRQSREQLAPIVLLADEATNLLNQSGIGDPLREVTQTARQYGVYLLLAGQNAKHSVIDTQTRDNFSTRLCFHTSPTSYRAVLGQSVDDVTNKGRAWAQLAGETLQQIQCPYVTREEVFRVLESGCPKNNIPAFDSVQTEKDTTTSRVIELKEQGLSDTAIARHVFGYGNNFYIGKVRDILQQQQ